MIKIDFFLPGADGVNESPNVFIEQIESAHDPEDADLIWALYGVFLEKKYFLFF